VAVVAMGQGQRERLGERVLGVGEVSAPERDGVGRRSCVMGKSRLRQTQRKHEQSIGLIKNGRFETEYERAPAAKHTRN